MLQTANREIVEIDSTFVRAKYSEKEMQRMISVSAWRAIWLAGGLSLIWPPTELMAGTTTSSISRTDEPFGLSTSMVTTGTLLEKWLKVEREVDDERLLLKICQDDRASCRSPAALQFLAIVDSARALAGRARLGEINRAINLTIRPMSDLALYGEEDVWSPPLATLAEGAGDCEDYAIAKFVALQEAGVSAVDLRIVILRDDIWEEDHAVVAARLDGNWLMLDNRHMVMAEDNQVRKYFRPVFLVDHNGVRRYSSSSPTSDGSRGMGEF